MRQIDIEHILAAVKAPLDHPLFYPRVFALTVKIKRKEHSTEEDTLRSITEEYEELSRRLDRSQIQESCAVRNVLRTRQLAQQLIDEKGEIKLDLLPKIISYLKNNLYSLGPFRQYDAKRQEHILKVLQLIHANKDLRLLLKKFSRPLSNKGAEDVIRHTLQLPPHVAITDQHTKQAVLSAWLCYLRQNVGSCFATAPAEIVHDEQPELFLQDLLDLLSTGRLKRTFGGVEYSVPLSTSWGSGDLKKPLLIKISQQEIKPEVWYAPGLLMAFEAIGFLNAQDPLKQKMELMEGWIKPLIQQQSYPYAFCVLTAEDILRQVLLQSLGMTEQQLKEYENRPRAMMQTELVRYTPQMTKSAGGIGERCAHFFTLFDTAKLAFKALADNALLKTWEFTLASFAETKYEFTRWNLYSSLGLKTDEPGGIGQCIYQTIQHKVEQSNRQTEDIQAEYEMVYTQVKTLESRMRHASTEKEVQWLKIEYQSRSNEFYFLEEQRNAAQAHAQALVNLYDTLYKLYVELFKDFFQEVYDADMQQVTTGPFDDSPAGFRLLYKHGRSNTSQWTRIQNQYDFIEALTSFFVATEPQIAHVLEEKKVEKDLAEVVTAIVNHIKTKEFLESAFHRMAMAHKTPLVQNPLEHLDQIEKKPWAYTSGGTMNTLVSCYYRIEDKPKEIEKWVESEMELLVHITDALKQTAPRFLDAYVKGRRQAMLMQSPTHAFLLKPMLFPFRETWLNDEFTYTFVRDRFVRPAEMFVERMLLNDEMISLLVQQLTEKIPENFQPRFKAIANQIRGPLSPLFFREHLAEALGQDRGLRYGSRAVLSLDELDSFLYASLPLSPLYELKERLHKIFQLLPGLNAQKIEHLLQLFEQIPLSKGRAMYIGAQQLQDICKALLCLSQIQTTGAYDYHLQVSLAAQKLEFAMPTPLIFADTNWVKDEFGFVVNPGTGKLELWRVDYTGSQGYPMSSWKQWMDGSRPDLKWGVYVKPFEYGQN